MHIYDHLSTIERWKNCPMANYVCPVARYTKLETHTPRGKALILSLIADGIRKIDEDFIDRIYQCDLCRACEAIRRDDTSIPDLILAARRDIVDKNICPNYIVNLRNEVLVKSRLLNENWVNETINKVKSSSKKLILITYESIYAKQSYSALMSILSIAGIEVMKVNLGKFPAPASILNELGYYKDANVALDNIRRLINADRTKKLIFLVPYDLDLLLKMSIDTDLTLFESNVQHGFEFLAEIIESSNLNISRNLKEPAMYFDFCSPRHLDKFYEIPRQVLKSIPNLEIKEMAWNKRESGSCGGLALPYTFPNISKGIATMVVDEASKSGAKILITPCAHCVENLASVQNSKDGLKIVDLWELIVSAV